jgi:divalent metal cation (Fe/Co/Zn/Cd) transporter
MLRSALVWLGFAHPENNAHGHGHGHDDHGHGGKHGHTHGVVDPTIATTERGIWAIKWSFVILAITAALQLTVFFASGSVALLADSIHNVGDAVTAIPLWIAFQLARRKPSARFTYGLGRVEDLAGVTIVAIILFSALVALYEAVDRLMHPQTITLLWAVAIAGFVGFVGNEAVAVFRIRLAVVLGAAGVWFGYPLADPIVGLLITLAIFGIVWQSTRAVFTRLLDGVEPGVIEEIRHAAAHVDAVKEVVRVRARWLGHRMTTELDVAVAGDTTVQEADAISAEVEGVVADHVPALASVHVRVRSAEAAISSRTPGHAGHASNPVSVKGALVDGVLEIIDTPAGERMRLTAARLPADAKVSVVISRSVGEEKLPLLPQGGERGVFFSTEAPAEPHEFSARLVLQVGEHEEVLAFRMTETR